MKTEDIYEQWKQKKKQVKHPVHMSAQVMEQIHAYVKATKRKASSEHLKDIPFIANRMMRFAAAMGLSALGFYRIYSVAGNLLIP